MALFPTYSSGKRCYSVSYIFGYVHIFVYLEFQGVIDFLAVNLLQMSGRFGGDTIDDGSEVNLEGPVRPYDRV